MKTMEVAKFLAKTNLSEIPQDVKEAAKRAILDYFSVVLAGSKERLATIVGEYAKSSKARPEAGVIGQGFKTEASLAALVNGASAHALDYDDFNLETMGHPTAAIMPAVLALAEKVRASGEAILEAYILGFEVAGKIGSLVAFPHYEVGWHTTGTLGTIGAVASASKLLKLDPRETSASIGIAASLASGLRQNFGTMTKPLHAGRAAQNGVMAALLAKSGFTASPESLEGQLGYGKVFAGGKDFGLGDKDLCLGTPFSLISPGLTVKLYPSCGTTHCGIEAALQISTEQNILPADITEVELSTHPMIPEVVFHHDPHTPAEARFSYEYCVSRALIHKKLSLTDFKEEAILEPQVRELMGKVRYVAASGKEEKYDLRADVTVKMRDGRVFSKKVEAAKGDPRNPLTLEELQGKFRDCASYTLSAQNVEMALRLISDIDHLADIRKLMEIVTQKGKAMGRKKPGVKSSKPKGTKQQQKKTTKEKKRTKGKN